MCVCLYIIPGVRDERNSAQLCAFFPELFEDDFLVVHLRRLFKGSRVKRRRSRDIIKSTERILWRAVRQCTADNFHPLARHEILENNRASKSPDYTSYRGSNNLITCRTPQITRTVKPSNGGIQIATKQKEEKEKSIAEISWQQRREYLA